jgi:hypothetical protein
VHSNGQVGVATPLAATPIAAVPSAGTPSPGGWMFQKHDNPLDRPAFGGPAELPKTIVGEVMRALPNGTLINSTSYRSGGPHSVVVMIRGYFGNPGAPFRQTVFPDGLFTYTSAAGQTTVSAYRLTR